ncbi:hypothetical protein AAMO2058_000321600 [Amorphochlora amoebiformis]
MQSTRPRLRKALWESESSLMWLAVPFQFSCQMALGFCLCFHSHVTPLSVCLTIPPPFPACSLSNPLSSEFYTSTYIMPWIHVNTHHAADIYQVSPGRQPRDRLQMTLEFNKQSTSIIIHCIVCTRMHRGRDMRHTLEDKLEITCRSLWNPTNNRHISRHILRTLPRCIYP